MLVQDGVEVPEEDIKELTEVPESVHDLFETAAFIGAGPFRDRYYPFPSPTVDDGGPRAFYVGFSEARRLSSVGVH
jgi:hypothetical protein